MENNFCIGRKAIIRVRGLRAQIKRIFFELKNFYQYFLKGNTN